MCECEYSVCGSASEHVYIDILHMRTECVCGTCKLRVKDVDVDFIFEYKMFFAFSWVEFIECSTLSCFMVLHGYIPRNSAK